MARPTRLSLWLWLMLAGVGAGTLFAFLGRRHWVLDLFTPFHLQYAAGALLVLLLALPFRLWRPAALALALLLANLPALLYYFPARAPANALQGRPTLRVVSFNVLTSNPEKDGVRRYLQDCEADVIVILESSREWSTALEPLETTHPHVVKAPRRDNFGISLYSRHPILDWEISSVAPFEIPLLRAAITADDSEFTVFGAHPLPPVNARNWNSRNAYLADLAQRTRDATRPTIVMGDFNATPWSPFFADLVEDGNLQDSGRRRGFQSTWQRRHPLFSIPIDHILHSEDLSCTHREIGPDLGSDHRALVADFSLTNP